MHTDSSKKSLTEDPDQFLKALSHLPGESFINSGAYTGHANRLIIRKAALRILLLGCFDISQYLLKILADTKVLRTCLFALSALLAGFCCLAVLYHIIPVPFYDSVVLVHMITVPYTEIARNIDSEGPWHTVSAAGTSILDTAVHDLLDPVYSLIFLIGHGLKISKG